MYNITHDWWCEQRMWHSVGVGSIPIVEPISAVTGLLMTIFALIPNSASSVRLPLIFLFYKASLVMLGLGTTVFHCLEYGKSKDVHFNLNFVDWAPISLSTSILFVIYLQPVIIMFNSYIIIAIYLCIIVWVMFNVAGMDTDTYLHLESYSWGSILNASLLFPLVTLLVVYTFSKFFWKSWLLWLMLLISLILWLINVYACSYWVYLSIFHGVYHLTISYSLLLAGCFGLTISGEWELEHGVWPRVKNTKSYESLKTFEY